MQLQWHHISSESLSFSLSHTHTHTLNSICSLLLHQIPVESDESDTDQKNEHSSDEEGAQEGSADEAHSANPPPPPLEDNGERSGANGKSIRKEKVEDSDSELNHSDVEDELEAGGSQGGMDQSECSASELVDSMEQDLDGSNQLDST